MSAFAVFALILLLPIIPSDGFNVDVLDQYGYDGLSHPLADDEILTPIAKRRVRFGTVAYPRRIPGGSERDPFRLFPFRLI
uniref:COesterase domain-containing protein n=1 Tax=Steinernema glaseri TaxID=37863 RepID=A0A1I8AJ25_9BILA